MAAPRLRATTKSRPAVPVLAPPKPSAAPTLRPSATPPVSTGRHVPVEQAPATPLPGTFPTTCGGCAPLTPGLVRSPVPAAPKAKGTPLMPGSVRSPGPAAPKAQGTVWQSAVRAAREPALPRALVPPHRFLQQSPLPQRADRVSATPQALVPPQCPVQQTAVRQGADKAPRPTPAPPLKPPALRQVLEKLFSDENLRHDIYLHGLLRKSHHGWIDLDVVCGLPGIKALHAKRIDILKLLQSSQLETQFDAATGATAVRRPPSHGPLPQLSAAALAKIRAVVSADVAPHTRGLDDASALPLAKKPRKAERRLCGVVSSFNLRLGMGKITCKDLGRDVAVDVQELSGFDVGDKVCFTLTTDPDLGTPKAQSLVAAAPGDSADGVLEEPDDGAACSDEERGRPAHSIAQQAAHAVVRPAVRKAPAAPPRTVAAPEPKRDGKPKLKLGARVSGTIRTISLKMGVGSIKCAGSGGLIEVSAESLVGFEEGDSISFSVAASGEAIEVEAA